MTRSLSFRLHGVQKVERADDVDPEVPDRLFKRLAYQSECREMTYRVDPFHGALGCCLVEYVASQQLA